MAHALDRPPEGADDLPQWWRAVPIVLAVLLALSLGLIVFLADRASEQRDRAFLAQRHSFEVMMRANRLKGSIADAELRLARYVVSQDDAVGLAFQKAWRNARAEAAALDQATRNNGAQHRDVAIFRTSLEAHGTALNGIVRRARDRQPDALARLLQAGDSQAVPRLNAALDRIIMHEKAELARYNILLDRSEIRIDRVNSSYGLIGLGLLAAALLALWFAYGAARERRFARRLAAAEAARVDGLEIAVRERTEELQNANAQLRREMEVRTKAEQGLRQLQKMEAIGKLTGGIAHDFNNMLAVIVSGIDLARQSVRRDPTKARRHLDSAMEGASRAAALTVRLLAFARPEPPAAMRVDPDALVLGMRDLIDRATDDGIALVLDLAAEGWHIWIEDAQLEHALLNLAINARDAMDGRGTLTIATRRMTLAPGEIGPCPPGDYVCLSVTDTGCGMSPDVIERAFEPFFTTKPVGKGTGLGLSQIFAFARASGGEIDLRSTPGSGSTFRLFLPRHLAGNEGLEPELPMPEWTAQHAAGRDNGDSESGDDSENGDDDGAAGPQPGPAAADRLVLVVEDDSRVLRSTVAALKALGYRGLACDHPRKAAPLLHKHPDTALILSDVLMPDMTGPEMVAALAKDGTNKPVIFVTGFAGEGERAAQLAGVPILRKPFTLAQLGRAIAEALDTPRRDLPVTPAL
jgi:signal transduction histidine kinase/ActR/RegA family two-component response regulator